MKVKIIMRVLFLTMHDVPPYLQGDLHLSALSLLGRWEPSLEGQESGSPSRRGLGGRLHSAGTGSRFDSNFATQVTALLLLKRERK